MSIQIGLYIIFRQQILRCPVKMQFGQTVRYIDVTICLCFIYNFPNFMIVNIMCDSNECASQMYVVYS